MKKAIITTLVLIVALVSVFCLVACGDGATDAKPEEDKIVGMWSGVVTENNSAKTIVKGYSYHLTVTYNAQEKCFDFSQHSVFNHADPDALYGSRTVTGGVYKNAINGSLYSIHTSFTTSMLPEKLDYDIEMESDDAFIVWRHSYGSADANKKFGGKLRFERTDKTVEEFVFEIKNNYAASQLKEL